MKGAQTRWNAVTAKIDGFETRLRLNLAGGGLPQADPSSEL
jgi:hypothetical protein